MDKAMLVSVNTKRRHARPSCILKNEIILFTDHSCLMGNPSYGDDGPVLCWNAVKSWIVGWYAADSVTVDPSDGSANNFTLVGVADWANYVYSSGLHKVVLQIKDSSQTQDFYVIYNRAKGPNGGVTFAKDQVRELNHFLCRNIKSFYEGLTLFLPSLL